MLTPLKILMGLVGVFWMALAGGAAVYWWATQAPAGWPNYRLGWRIVGITLHLPDGPGAKLNALQKASKAALAHAKVVEVQRATISTDAGVAEAKAQEHIRIVYQTITRSVPTYVTPEIDRTFHLPVGLIRVHDAAARGVPTSEVPGPAGQSDDAPSDVRVSNLAAVVALNYGACKADGEQLGALQQWLRDQAAVK